MGTKFSVNDSIWVAAATLSYEKYHKGITNIAEYTMKQKEIREKASLLNDGQKPEEARTSQWCSGNHPKHTHPYLRNINESDRSLAFPGDFGGGEIPESLDDDIEIDTEVGKITIGELKRFVNTEYLEMKKQIVVRTNLRAFVERFLNEYVQEKSNTFAGNPLGEFIRNSATKLVKQAGNLSDSDYVVTGSVGQGNWAMVPWLGVFNKKITTSATKGVYIVYLLAKDGKTLYLTFNQGCTELRKSNGKKETINIMRTNASKLVKVLDDHGFKSDENIDLGDDLTELGELYQKGTIFYKAYKQGAVPAEPELKKDLNDMIEIYNQYIDEVVEGNNEYWPSKEEYDPGITTEQWIDILKNPEITSENNLMMFAMMLKYGKPATCTQLAERFGKTKNYFNSGSSSYAEQVAKKTGCPIPPERINNNARWWPILYVGRDAKKEEKGSYVWKLRDELKSALEQIELPEVKEIKDMSKGKKLGLNTILYGPPGTGKTYNTVRYAVSICEPDLDVDSMEYSDVLAKFKELKDQQGRIEFTTFHQSYGYEEFIEGIKPIMVSNSEAGDSKDVKYDVIPGVFKEFCTNAAKKKVETKGFDIAEDASIWKVTVRSEVRQDCFDNNRVRIDWDFDTDGAHGFVYDMAAGDIILTTDGNRRRINGIAVITSEEAYEFGDGEDKTTRDVKWLAKGIDVDITDINAGKMLHRMTAARVPKMKVADIVAVASEKNQALADTVIEENTKPYVFIIDEINRGNISKIFGELITLIEETKRAGADEAMEATLPYSGDPFSVPNNVYILGTMNTADRSIALMDTALRRRFDFIEMMPDTNVLRNIEADKVEDLDVAAMLDTINERIKFLYDREHTIGHAFFTGLKDDPTVEKLASIFSKSVIPLLQEYFYEDYQKIQFVLGDNGKTNEAHKFIKDTDVVAKNIFKGSVDDVVDLPEKKYEINEDALKDIESYKEIM